MYNSSNQLCDLMSLMNLPGSHDLYSVVVLLCKYFILILYFLSINLISLLFHCVVAVIMLISPMWD